MKAKDAAGRVLTGPVGVGVGVCLLMLLGVAGMLVAAFLAGVLLLLLLGSSFQEAVNETWGAVQILGAVSLFCVVLALIWLVTWSGLKRAWKEATGEEGEEAEKRLKTFLIYAVMVFGLVGGGVWILRRIA